MTIALDRTTPEDVGVTPDATPQAPDHAAISESDFELDVTIVEGSSTVDRLLRLTDDNCGVTCQSACNSC